MTRKPLKAALVFVAIMVAGFVVAMIVGFLQGDCGTAPTPAEVEACVGMQHRTFLGIMAATFVLSALSAFRVARGRD